MKLVEKHDGYEIYDIENGYIVTKETCSWIPRGFKLQFNSEIDSYLPQIYDSIDCLKYRDSGLDFVFEIQTTSYGSLAPEDINKVISGYHTALNTVKIVEEAFKKTLK